MSAARKLPKAAQLEVSGIVAPIVRTLQAGERIVRRNEAGELVTLDLAEIARRVGDATGHRIAVARRTPVKVVDASGRVVRALSADEFFAKLLSRHFGVEVTPPKPNAKATLFWCACGEVEELPRRGTWRKQRCASCVRAHQREMDRARWARNGDHLRAAARSWKRKNPDKARAAKRAWEESHRATALQQKRDWAAKNAETCRVKARERYAANRDAILARRRARRAAKKSGGSQ